MPDPYQLDLTAAQVNQAINAAYDSDQAPVSGQTNLVNSDKIAAYVTNAVGAETSAREAADTALDGRVTALEGVTANWATFTKSSGVATATGKITGYSEVDAGGIASESSGDITISGSGIYLVSFEGQYKETFTGSSFGFFTVEYKIGDTTVSDFVVNESSSTVFSFFSCTRPITVSVSETLAIKLTETGTTAIGYEDVAVTITKIA